ncbi:MULTISPECIES: DUF1292 domain-containing protein [Metabacillus]|jgi:hypothetical protein|uniref:DUF1292 domain-containing protein n=1 Tax=Metabacillus rhizolycopersici TaxID=2875709 RepID=A0ABS7USC0_9BACI|nr:MULTISPECIES: DUF1292 domain-containing protein [Metabacillus]MBZ5751031.1 DUF1292 domain-containing protein [Metabacillus rhizolycopersici]MCM3651856.1 DUF1292 domain-containing protein [Metabacillus litoralis]
MDKIEVGEVFTITDENDQENEIEVLAVITLEGTDYAAVGFLEDIQEDSEEEIDVFFLKVDAEGDFSAIESDEEFEKVSVAFEEIMTEEE